MVEDPARGALAQHPTARPVFRRPTPDDAMQLARETFLANERVDMQTLAAQLGVGRTTLHRWIQTREALLDRVLGELAREFFAQARAAVTGDPASVIAQAVATVVDQTASFIPLRGFVDREPELALRLLLGADLSVRAELVAGLRDLVTDVLPDEAVRLEGFVRTVVEVGVSLEWPTFVAGQEVSGVHIAEIARALLVAARAGALSAENL